MLQHSKKHPGFATFSCYWEHLPVGITSNVSSRHLCTIPELPLLGSECPFFLTTNDWMMQAAGHPCAACFSFVLTETPACLVKLVLKHGSCRWLVLASLYLSDKSIITVIYAVSNLFKRVLTSYHGYHNHIFQTETALLWHINASCASSHVIMPHQALESQRHVETKFRVGGY